MSDETDDEDLWTQARADDGTAFAALFRRHRDAVYRRALGLMSETHAAEEVTASVFFELWRRQGRVRLVDGTIRPWLLVTTLNVARNHQRGARRYRRLIDSLPRDRTGDVEDEAVGNLETEILGLRLKEALARISPADAALLSLTALDGLTIVDASAVLGIRPGTARMRLQRARARLRADLESTPHAVDARHFEGDLA